MAFGCYEKNIDFNALVSQIAIEPGHPPWPRQHGEGFCNRQHSLAATCCILATYFGSGVQIQYCRYSKTEGLCKGLNFFKQTENFVDQARDECAANTWDCDAIN